MCRTGCFLDKKSWGSVITEGLKSLKTLTLTKTLGDNSSGSRMIGHKDIQHSAENRIVFSPFSESDMNGAMRLKEQAGWNQTEKDWQRLLDLLPKGSFVARLDDRLIGTVTTISYEKELAWIGMMLVDPHYRRRRIGTTLMERALNYLQGVGIASIKLDATPAGRPLYESLGFKVEGRIERWEGVAPELSMNDGLEIGAELRPKIDELDHQAFGVDRRALLDRLVKDCPVKPLMVTTPEGLPEGYALARPGTSAFYIGPVVAKGKEAALLLLDGMLSQLAGKKIYLDFNTAFAIKPIEELTRRGFVKQRDLQRMGFGRENSAGTSDLIFGIAGPELG